MSAGNVKERLIQACSTEDGLLTIVNLDNFHLFNDIYGEDLGKKLLEVCARIIDSVTEGDDIKASLGGDEFVIFCRGLKDKNELVEIHEYINEKINESLPSVVGADDNISLGVSMGAVLIPEEGTDYEELFEKADKALDFVKQSGGHNIAFYEKQLSDKKYLNDLDNLSKEMDENSDERGCMWLSHADFSILYRFLRRYIETYKKSACKMLVTFSPVRDDVSDDEFAQIVKGFGNVINAALRRSDIMMQSRNNQFFLLLPEMTEETMILISERFKKRWKEIGLDSVMNMNIEGEIITPNVDEAG